MTTRRITAALALLAAAALTSCTVGAPPDPNANTGVGGSDSSTSSPVAVETPEPLETEPAEAEAEPEEPAAEAGAVESSDEIVDGPTKKELESIAGQVEAYIAANGAPGDCTDTIAFGATGISEATDVACMYEKDGSISLHAWNSDDPNYFDFNTGLRYNSETGFEPVN